MYLIFSALFLISSYLSAAVDFPDQDTADEVQGTRDFFNRNEDYQWDIANFYYGSPFLGRRTEKISLDDTMKLALHRGFETRLGVQTLYRARMARHVALGNLLPKFSV